MRQKNPAAIALFNLCCFLAPEEIPLPLLREHRETLPEELAALLADELALNEAIGELRRYSLLARDGEMLVIHRLVQVVARDQMGEVRSKIWAEAAGNLLRKAYRFDQHDMTTWVQCGQLLPHVTATANLAAKWEIESNQAAFLNNEAGFYLQHYGNLAKARPYYERALEIRERVLGPDHPDTARSIWWMGVLAQEDGDLETARAHYQRAISIFTEKLGPDHSLTRGVLGYLQSLS